MLMQQLRVQSDKQTKGRLNLTSRKMDKSGTAESLPSDQLESRIQGSLPPLAYMVSRLRQPIAAGEDLLRRFDAGVRPYWLRDWQYGFGGYTKVYEYQVEGETRRWFSVAHVVRPRTSSTNACLCFTLMSKLPEREAMEETCRR